MADQFKINNHLLLTLLSVTALGLTITSLISSNNESDNVVRLTWALGKQTSCTDNCAKLYIGVWEILVKIGEFTTSQKWKADDCTAEYCDKCQDSMKVCIGFVALAFIFTWPSIFTNFFRMSETGNTKVNKYAGAFFSFLCMSFSIISIVVFTAGCFKYIKNDITMEVNWNYGPSWILMLIVCVLKGIDVIANLYLPEITA